MPENTFSNYAFTRDTLYVPYGTTEKYQEKEVWKNFTNIKESEPTTVMVTVGEEGLATYCPAVDVDFTEAENIAAYTASIDGNIANRINLTRVYTVAAGEGVLLRSLSGNEATEELPIATEPLTKNANNAFVGVLENVTMPHEKDGNIIYVLANVDGKVGFFTTKEMTVEAGKAYLPIKSSEARALTMAFDDTTGIIEIASEQSPEKDAVYTLGGVRVKTPGKGLYIKNGKKVVIK